jgi:uncharacterized peroxidase-related enzyme
MSWIESIQPAQAGDSLRKHYRRVVGDRERVDNVLAVHALRPQSLLAHMGLYKAVMHHSDLQLPLWLREAIGVYVSRLNRCDYCVAHHRCGLSAALAQAQQFDALDQALSTPRPGPPFTTSEQLALEYARKLTVAPSSLLAEDIHAMREGGFSDGEILEINQVVAYFCYVNRVVIGLGVELEQTSDAPAQASA